MKDGPLREKSYLFALKVIRLSKFLFETQKEFVLGRQLLRSGTSIGAQISEAAFALTKREFLSKMSIALREANETNYWLNLLKDSGIISPEHFQRSTRFLWRTHRHAGGNRQESKSQPLD